MQIAAIVFRKILHKFEQVSGEGDSAIFKPFKAYLVLKSCLLGKANVEVIYPVGAFVVLLWSMFKQLNIVNSATMMCLFCYSSNASQVCSKCTVARYCNATCQRSHWPAHKDVCKPPQTSQPQSASSPYSPIQSEQSTQSTQPPPVVASEKPIVVEELSDMAHNHDCRSQRKRRRKIQLRESNVTDTTTNDSSANPKDENSGNQQTVHNKQIQQNDNQKSSSSCCIQ